MIRKKKPRTIQIAEQKAPLYRCFLSVGSWRGILRQKGENFANHGWSNAGIKWKTNWSKTVISEIVYVKGVSFEDMDKKACGPGNKEHNQNIVIKICNR